MRSKTNVWKRALSAFLSLVMVLAMVPAMGVVQEAEAAVGDSAFISMPITIRDYAADGMLFEFNQVGATGTAITGTNTDMSVKVNPTTFNNDNYSWVCVFNGRTSQGNSVGVWWHDIYVNADGSINRVYQSGITITDTTIPSGGMYIAVHSNCEDYYSTLSMITNANKDNYRFSLSGTTLTLTAGTGTSGTYKQADTAGFSLLATGAADHINNLTDSASIPGTQLIQNGSWGSQTDPAAKNVTLTSGAKQEVYGAWIRTDLVQDRLVNGEMVYTEAAVDYLADYMSQIMPIPWQNSDGSYNTYHVQGHELSELNGSDLAAKIRAEATGGMGTYTAAKEKFEAGNLNDYTGIETWYDAAYFLLHNVFNDNTGYGKSVSNYKNLELVQTTNTAGETCYTFNSGYDGAVYDYTNGVIYNTQTSNITIAKTNSGTETYVRGNALPDARFDPLGLSGAKKELGYGMSGDTYGDLISPSTADWNTYYDNTNYNLSLEGHAQFIYYEDDDLYFTFTGDDDVYLFINGVRVLDVGAAHSISKVKINLNDVAELCELRDGQAYDFDFFYMERHGTAANFGIETNIKIVDPAMLTTKTGYQNGVSTGYNGFVDPNKPVGYSFELQNNGDADLTNLTFEDNDIGVKFTKDQITLNSDSDINAMYAILYAADGTMKSYYKAGQLTEDILKNMLTTGIAVGEKIGIYGFKYKISNTEWNAGGDTFTNTVHTTGVADADNVNERTLNGIAEWKVQKMALVTETFHVYDWVTKDAKDTSWTSPVEDASVTVPLKKLVQPIEDAGVSVDENAATIVLCSASGNEGGVNQNLNAMVNPDKSITYRSTTTGVDTVYYKVKGIGYNDHVLRYDVYTYGTVNNDYVLDYGLSVELNKEFGLRENDVLTLDNNPNATSASTTSIQDATTNFGTFTWTNSDSSLKYTPEKIINNIDSVRANVRVMEKGASELTIYTGVDMYETITTAPASVVYYEENFPGITYVEKGENGWVHYETVDEDGNSVAGDVQSADQDSNYGSDPNYAEDKTGTFEPTDDVGTVEKEENNEEAMDTSGEVIDSVSFVLDISDLDALQKEGIDALNAYLGLGGSDSNGSLNSLVVKTTAEVMYFDFVGTGFEIVSRTTDEAYAVINVQVLQKDENGEWKKVVKQKPVITESKGGDLYQVPIISITDLPHGEYRISVKATASTANKTRVLYIDGIRIYGPLENGDALNYYNPEEYNAQVFEIKQLIQKGQMIYTCVSDSGDVTQLAPEAAVIEDVSGDFVLKNGEKVEQYLQVGPNNELYLDPGGSNPTISFFVVPDETVPESARTIEIGAHRKSDSMFDWNGVVTMCYGSTADDILATKNSYNIESGTEMYYTIDINKLVKDEEGKYLVLICGRDSENYAEALALTNLKISGYEVKFAEEEVKTAAEYGRLRDLNIVSETFALYNTRETVTEETNPTETEPAVENVNENLSIVSASLKADSVVSGKVATVSGKVTPEVAAFVITDDEGNVVEPERCTMKADGDIMRFSLIWKVTGSRGDVQKFTVTAYDANGLASVNQETVTVTIK